MSSLTPVCWCVRVAETGAGTQLSIEHVLWIVFFLILMLHGLSLTAGGYLHYEGQFFLAAQLDQRDVMARLFSAHFNEWDCYQGRELSFAAGLLDAQFIALSARRGAANLYSLTTCVSILAAAILLWRLVPRLAPPLDISISGLLVSLFLTSPVASLSSYFYRPAKALAALFFVLVLSIITTIRASGDNTQSRRWLLLGGAAVLMGLSDRVGLFLILAIAVIVAIREWPLDARTANIVLTLMVALLVDLLWSAMVGPRLAAMVDGVWPDTRNQQISLRYTFGNLVHFKAAFSLWFDQLAFQFGNLGLISVLFLPLLAAIQTIRNRRVSRSLVASLTAVAMALALYAAMYAKLNSLAWPESRRVYYWLPGAVVISIGAALALAPLIARRPRLELPIKVMLAVMVFSNVVSLRSHAAVVRAGEQRSQILEAPRVRECMQKSTLAIREAGISPAAAMACYRVRLAAFGSHGITESPPRAAANPLLYCRAQRKSQPALRSLGP